MKNKNFLSLLLVGIFATVANIGFATEARSFISASGADTPTPVSGVPCNINFPCRNLSYALLNTSPNGEIIIISSGNYGNNISITQSVDIKAANGIYAGIASNPTKDGIVINGSGINVKLTNLQIVGAGGNSGIKVLNAGSVQVIDTLISSMAQNGILQQAGSLVVVNSAVNFNNVGINNSTNPGYVVTKIERSHVSNNTTDGLLVGNLADVDVMDSALSGNGVYGIHVNATTNAAPPTVVTVDNTELLYNGLAPNVGGGIIVSDSGSIGVGNGAHLIMSKSKIRPVVAISGIVGLTITGDATGAELISNFIIGSPGFGLGGTSAISITRAGLAANASRVTNTMPVFLKQGTNFLGGSNHPLSLNGAHCDLIDPNTGLATGNTCGVDYMINEQDFF